MIANKLAAAQELPDSAVRVPVDATRAEVASAALSTRVATGMEARAYATQRLPPDHASG